MDADFASAFCHSDGDFYDDSNPRNEYGSCNGDLYDRDGAFGTGWADPLLEQYGGNRGNLCYPVHHSTWQRCVEKFARHGVIR